MADFDLDSLLSILRVILYVIIALGATGLAVDDWDHRRGRALIWAALSGETYAVMGLLLLDVALPGAWIGQRWILTPFALGLALAISGYIWAQVRQRRLAKRVLAEMRRNPESILEQWQRRQPGAQECEQ
jgi:hypothetical protein